jgi:hypothetical protein
MNPSGPRINVNSPPSRADRLRVIDRPGRYAELKQKITWLGTKPKHEGWLIRKLNRLEDWLARR